MSASPKTHTLRVLHLTRTHNPGARGGAQLLAPVDYSRQLPSGKMATFRLDWPVLAPMLKAPTRSDDAGLARGVGKTLREALLSSGWTSAETELLEALKRGPVTLLIQLNADELYGLQWEAMPLGENGTPLADVPGLRALYDEPRPPAVQTRTPPSSTEPLASCA